jgi:hypothetical protein
VMGASEAQAHHPCAPRGEVVEAHPVAGGGKNRGHRTGFEEGRIDGVCVATEHAERQRGAQPPTGAACSGVTCWGVCVCCRPSPAAPTWSHGTPAGGGVSRSSSSSHSRSSRRKLARTQMQQQEQQHQQQVPCIAATATPAAAQGAGAMAACQGGSDRREGHEAVPTRHRPVVLVQERTGGLAGG